MSDEERKDIPPEPAPEEGRESWSSEDAPIVPEEPVDRIAERLDETADTITQGLRDLQDELLPPTAEEPTETPLAETPLAETPTWETPEPVNEPLVLTAAPPTSGQEASKGSAAVVREGSDDDRLLAALAWLSMVILQLPIVSVIQLLSANTKDRPFQRHHAITSLLFYGAGIVYEILATVVFSILTAVTAGCGAICLWPIFLVPHALGLYYAFQAYSGKRVTLPFLTDFAKQQGWM